jgi:hypothetical protein
MSTQLKTTNIKGKAYVEVNTRIKYFRENYKHWSLESEIIKIDSESVLIKATIKNDLGRVISTGLAYETKDSSFINKTSHIENCETSAWGRALGNLGIGIDSSVASYEEVQNAITNQNKSKQTPKKLSQKPVKVLKTTTDRRHLDSLDSSLGKNCIKGIKEGKVSNMADLEKIFIMSENVKESLQILLDSQNS